MVKEFWVYRSNGVSSGPFRSRENAEQALIVAMAEDKYCVIQTKEIDDEDDEDDCQEWPGDAWSGGFADNH